MLTQIEHIPAVIPGPVTTRAGKLILKHKFARLEYYEEIGLACIGIPPDDHNICELDIDAFKDPWAEIYRLKYQQMVAAYNATYGAGINPAGVDAMLYQLQQVASHLDTSPNSALPFGAQPAINAAIAAVKEGF